MNQKYIVCLGFRTPLIEKVTQRGLRPIIIATKVKPGIDAFKYCIVNDLEDAQEILRVIMFMMPIDIIGIVTGHEEGVFTAALVRGYLGLSGPKSYGALLRFRDKQLQKSLLKGQVPCAESMYVSNHTSYSEIVSFLGNPFVIKPTNGAGSKRTTHIHDEATFIQYMRENPNHSDIALIAESTIQGIEYCVDGLWEDGRLVWFTICQYNTNIINFHSGKSVAVQILSINEHPSLYQSASDLITKALVTLNISTTVFHLEFFDTGENLIFSECGARLGGGLIPEIIEHSYGIDWFTVQFEQCMGITNVLHLPMTPIKCHAFVYLRSYAGTNQTEENYREIFHPVDIKFAASKERHSAGSYGNSGYIIVNDFSFQKLKSKVEAITTFNEGRSCV